MVIKFVEATVSYFDGDETLLPAALSSIDLVIPAGQNVLATGDSGCDKTTLLCCLNGLVPHFFDTCVTGNITLNDVPVARLPFRDLTSGVGIVFRDPHSESFTFDVASELAFCCENFAMPSKEIVRQVGEIASEVRTTDLLGCCIARLPGDEGQKLAIGSAMTLNPRVLLFDEPSASLSLDGLDMLHGVILDLRERRMTTVITNHRLSYLGGVISRCIMLETGRVIADITSDQLGQLPDVWFADHGLHRLRRTEFRSAPSDPFSQVGPRIRDIQFAYPRCALLWRIDELTLPTPGMTDVTGANGVDKTTLVKVLPGLLRSQGGIGWGERIWARRQRAHNCALAIQNVGYQLVGESARDEVLIGSPPGPTAEAQAVELLTRTDLEGLREHHPLTLSGGWKQHLGIALACMKQARVTCFDEPTSGPDAGNMQRISGLLQSVTGDGTLVLVITHDAESIESTFDHTVHIDGHQAVLEKLMRKKE